MSESSRKGSLKNGIMFQRSMRPKTVNSITPGPGTY